MAALPENKSFAIQQSLRVLCPVFIISCPKFLYSYSYCNMPVSDVGGALRPAQTDGSRQACACGQAPSITRQDKSTGKSTDKSPSPGKSTDKSILKSDMETYLEFWRPLVLDRCRYEYPYEYADEYKYEYEAGRLYRTTEVIRQCTRTRTEHEAPLNLFYCCFMPIWAPTMVQRVQNSGWGLFHGGCRAKPAISGQGVYMGVRVRVRTTLWPDLEISPMHQPTIHRPAPWQEKWWVARGCVF